jgi:hypothetical protein
MAELRRMDERKSAMGWAARGFTRAVPMPPRVAARYGMRVTLESMISLICSMISSASECSRCQTLRP